MKNNSAVLCNTILLHTQILKNKLLIPQDRFVYKSLTPWASALISAIQNIDIFSNTEKDYEKISDIYNNAAFILFSIGDVKSAREICYSLIQLCIHEANKTGDFQLYNHVFMPWINLIRIDRIQGKFAEARNKLSMMSDAKGVKLKVAENRLVRYFVSDKSVMNDDVEVYINYACATERIKLYLATHDYIGLSSFVKEKINNSSYANQFLFHEAMILALANSGKVDEAKSWLSSIKFHANLFNKNIFLLRECEIKLNKGIACFDEMQYLAEFSLCELQSKYLNSNEIVFALHVASSLSAMGDAENVIKLLYYCLEAADNLGDEVLKAEAIIAIYHQLKGGSGSVFVENLMIDHYVKTQYDFAQKIMLESFGDLKLVEYKKRHAVITTLFEELLSFATICLS